MKSKLFLRAVAVSVGAVLSVGSLSVLAGCGGIPANKEALVIMTEDLNELYNPFYSTAGTDMDVVGQTQISMLTTDANGELAYGKDEPTVVLDYKEEYDPAKNQTNYYYVLKNGLQFSDGVPLTMNDVMFNLYVYLDPAYTGSTTMYSTDIVGLQAYRTQSDTSDDSQDEELNNTANTYANDRLQELVDLYDEVSESNIVTGKHTATEEEMKAAIKRHVCLQRYLNAIGTDDQETARAQLEEDYKNALTKFKDELESDYKSAISSYTEAPYNTAPIYYNGKEIGKGFNEIISFMYAEHNVEIEYPRDPDTNQYDKSKIEKATLLYNPETVNTKELAINFVYNSNVVGAFSDILKYWATGTQVFTEYVAKAKDVILHGNIDSSELRYKKIEGVNSLGHDTQETVLTIGDKTYPIARDHNADGTPKEAGTYDVLRITINKIDPKAKWNFGFTVAPYHYYSDKGGNQSITKKNLAISDDASSSQLLKRSCWQNVTEVDIKAQKFGVAWADFDFQTSILQGDNSWGASKNKIPFGAGPYIASNKNDSTQPGETEFFSDNLVYYVRNPKFSLNGVAEDNGKFVPKIEKMRYMETPISNALSTLESGQVHFVSPQFTKENAEKIERLKSKGIGSVDSWQLGYGYIGINASKVKQLELRKAIMAAMNTSLALQYYQTGTAVNIYWPMSAVSWAYPREVGASYNGENPIAGMDRDNGHDYAQPKSSDIKQSNSEAITLINQYMAQSSAYTESDLEIEFTIAGANMYDHPAYNVFKNAMELLNSCGWDVTIKPDANALTKLSTGSLEVWAAAWGSTIDPDMYQVYHKNSTATSVLAWGYNAIKTEAGGEYAEEKRILNDLSEKIDNAREIDDSTADGKQRRANLYKQAMSLVLDLAIELPLYQRKTLYAYNLNVISEASMPHNENGVLAVNPYTSPLAKIWELEFVA